jgi:hypothetical protein
VLRDGHLGALAHERVLIVLHMRGTINMRVLWLSTELAARKKKDDGVAKGQGRTLWGRCQTLPIRIAVGGTFRKRGSI